MSDIQYYEQVLENISSTYHGEFRERIALIWIMVLVPLAILGLYSLCSHIRKKRLVSQTKGQNCTIPRNENTIDTKYAEDGKARAEILGACVILVAFFVITQIVVCVEYHKKITNIRQDIAEEAFEVYEGKICVDTAGDRFWGEQTIEFLSSDNNTAASECILFDPQNRNNIYPNHKPIKYSIRHGRVVYGKNSGFVVDWSIE